jgi:hypothetical protein
MTLDLKRGWMSTFGDKTHFSFFNQRKKMNLYFVSLLEPDVERKKNIACVYDVSEFDLDSKNQNFKYELYLILRKKFPFLSKGDIILTSSSWVISEGGNGNLSPFFYSHVPKFEVNWLTNFNKEKIRSSIDKAIMGNDLFPLQLPFKVGKKKFIFSFSYSFTFCLSLKQKFRYIKKKMSRIEILPFKFYPDYETELDPRKQYVFFSLNHW